jgi:hypothetical protein
VTQNNRPTKTRRQRRRRDRCADHPSLRLRRVAVTPRDDRVHLWLGQTARHDAQDQASRYPTRCRRFSPQPHCLQSRPHPETPADLMTARTSTHQHGAPDHPRQRIPVLIPHSQANDQWPALRFFSRLLAMEACCAAHFLGRRFASQKHTIRLTSAEYVEPHVKSQKTDDREWRRSPKRRHGRRCAW